MPSGFLAALRDPDLRKKILFTLGMIILYRIGAQIPTPGVDYQTVAAPRAVTRVQRLLLINLFSGGARRCRSSASACRHHASIIVQLLTVVIALRAAEERRPIRQAKMTQYVI